jgi:hypothetical protein
MPVNCSHWCLHCGDTLIAFWLHRWLHPSLPVNRHTPGGCAASGGGVWRSSSTPSADRGGGAESSHHRRRSSAHASPDYQRSRPSSLAPSSHCLVEQRLYPCTECGQSSATRRGVPSLPLRRTAPASPASRRDSPSLTLVVGRGATRRSLALPCCPFALRRATRRFLPRPLLGGLQIRYPPAADLFFRCALSQLVGCWRSARVVASVF